MLSDKTDILILGGGLAGGLIALELANSRPDLQLCIVEQGERLGGNHLWSFFATDLEEMERKLVEPLVVSRWDGYSVHFPGHSRDLTAPYRTIASEALDTALRARVPASALLTTTRVIAAGQHEATLECGRTLRAGGVIDARGASFMPCMQGGWQKFTGQMLRLSRPHGLEKPIVMDARVEQLDGYRFIYCLPFSEHEVFVEDTYYSEESALNPPDLQQRIAAYAAARGWDITEITREESGVLPVIAAGDFEGFWKHTGGNVAKAGTRAALIHPLTSYSLPDAVRFARHIGGLDDVSGAALAHASYAWAQRHWRRGRFYRMLTRMLFGAAQPQERYRILERFYRLSGGLIERFYAGRSTPADVLRVLAGRPPVPIRVALASLVGGGRPLASLEERR